MEWQVSLSLLHRNREIYRAERLRETDTQAFKERERKEKDMGFFLAFLLETAERLYMKLWTSFCEDQECIFYHRPHLTQVIIHSSIHPFFLLSLPKTHILFYCFLFFVNNSFISATYPLILWVATSEMIDT